MSSTTITAAAFAVGNIVSSVAIVLTNKLVFSGGFHFPMTLSFFHFLFAMLWYRVLALVGAYNEPPPNAMPFREQFKVAAAIFASIGFMNLSLNANSIGFYQVTKLTVIPCTLAINSYAYDDHTSTKIKFSLAILLAGVGIATVSEVQLKLLGVAYGVLAVLTTAVCQIWQGSKQKQFGLSATQLQALTAPWMSLQALAVALASEVVPVGSLVGSPVGGTAGAAGDTALAFFQAAAAGDGTHLHTLLVVLATCALALAVNFTVFGLIGKTSAVTFQVVGHLKTCLVLVGGYVLFPSHGTGKRQQQQLVKNVIGVSIAMVGVILYGHLKHASGQKEADCFDGLCPTAVLSAITSDEEKQKAAELRSVGCSSDPSTSSSAPLIRGADLKSPPTPPTVGTKA